MIEADMHEAKKRLSQLVESAERGEPVFLKRNGSVVAQIVPTGKGELPFGFLKGEVAAIPDSLLFGASEEHLDEFTSL